MSGLKTLFNISKTTFLSHFIILLCWTVIFLLCWNICMQCLCFFFALFLDILLLVSLSYGNFVISSLCYLNISFLDFVWKLNQNMAIHLNIYMCVPSSLRHKEWKIMIGRHTNSQVDSRNASISNH